MPIRAIIFDFGNVLASWNPYAVFAPYFDGDPAAVDAFLKEVNFHDWNLAQDAGRPFSEGVAVLSAQFPRYAAPIRAYDAHWEACITGEIAGSVEIARRLKQRGYPLYGLTNFSAEKFPFMRQRFAFLNLFDDIIVSGEEGLIKPDPAIYELTLRRIGRSAPECVFIDDSEVNYTTANQLGFVAILFKNADQLLQDLRQLGVL